MKSVTVNVFNIIGNTFCVEADDGEKVYNVIQESLKKKNKIVISFQNVEMITSAFLNTAIGQAYRDFDEDTIKQSISLAEISNEDKDLLKRVVDTEKLYYKNPKKMEESINEILGD